MFSLKVIFLLVLYHFKQNVNSNKYWYDYNFPSHSNEQYLLQENACRKLTEQLMIRKLFFMLS